VQKGLHAGEDPNLHMGTPRKLVRSEEIEALLEDTTSLGPTAPSSPLAGVCFSPQVHHSLEKCCSDKRRTTTQNSFCIKEEGSARDRHLIRRR
jgi:hypothetical protein